MLVTIIVESRDPLALVKVLNLKPPSSTPFFFHIANHRCQSNPTRNTEANDTLQTLSIMVHQKPWSAAFGVLAVVWIARLRSSIAR